MITIRQTFQYLSNATPLPFFEIALSGRFSAFSYIRSAGTQVVRLPAAATDIRVVQGLSDPSYSIEAPSSLLTGSSARDHANFVLFSHHALVTRQLQPLELAIPVTFLVDGAPVGGTELQAYYWFKGFSNLLDLAMNEANGALAEPAQQALTAVEDGIVLINKHVYEKANGKLQNLAHRNDDFLLFELIADVLNEDLMEPSGHLRFGASTTLQQRLQAKGIENRNEIVQFLGEALPQLVDFPLAVPEIKLLKIAGTFAVIEPAGSRLGHDDLYLYRLTARLQPANGGKERSELHDWATSPAPGADNKTTFSLLAHHNFALESLASPVIVEVLTHDGIVLWSQSLDHRDPALASLAIEVARSSSLPVPSSAQPTERAAKRLRGSILQLRDECPLKGATVVLQAKKGADEHWSIVGAAQADATGNFSIPYPYGTYTAAQAIVSLAPNEPAAIAIRSGTPDATISDDFLWLLVKQPECPETAKDVALPHDCDCNAPLKSPRLPDHADLIASDDYTQDIGGSCVNLSTPNRTLNEYRYTAIVRTSDPDVAKYALTKKQKKQKPDEPPSLAHFQLIGGTRTLSRGALSLHNPINWQDAPDDNAHLNFYQAVTVATGHVLHYKSIFKADGYSLGNLLYSLALAPGQKKRIVVMDAKHSLQGAESQNLTQGESLAASLINERSITDQLSGGINEALSGSSSASTGGISAGLGASGTLGFVSAALGVAGGHSGSDASASQNNSRDTAMFFAEKLRQSLIQNAESYRALNATVVSTVTEGQQYSVTTDVVANHNHCHALTMMYFEVLRHYAIFQELVSVEECIFVPLLMTDFTTENIFKWQDVLARHLLPVSANTYLRPFAWLRQHPLLKAFDAIERIKTGYANVDFPNGRYCDEPIDTVSGTITMRIAIPRPKTKYDRILSLPVIRTTVTTQGGVDVAATARDNVKSVVLGAVTGGLYNLFGSSPGNVSYTTQTQEILTRGKVFFDSIMSLDENYESVPPAQCIRVLKFDPQVTFFDGVTNHSFDFFANEPDDRRLWDAYAQVLGWSTRDLLEKFAGNVISDWDRIFYDEIAPLIVKKLFNEKRFNLDPLGQFDVSALDTYAGQEQLIRYRFRASTSLTRADILEVTANYEPDPAIVELQRLREAVRFDLENLTINYSTAHYNGKIFDGYIGDDLLDNVTNAIKTPLNSDEKKNPRNEDIYAANKLLEHLNSNLEHYNKVLWLNLDPDRRYMLLDGCSIQVYNDFGVPVAMRSLASVVKNELLTITGNSLVFPVAAGYRVGQAYVTEALPNGENVPVSLLAHYRPLTPIPPFRLSVPTRGVFLEAVQGYCDACEKVKENSSQDWTRFTTDEPSSINAVTPPVPVVTNWKPDYKDFAPPIVNIQNTPSTPAPGAGLAGLADLLGKSGIFKDVTGLDATQQNTIKTYLSNQENAKAFAEMASHLATQAHTTEHSDQFMNTAKSALDSGAITKAEYGQLVKDHLQKQIDGGEAQSRKDADSARKQQPSTIKEGKDLAEQGQQVEVTETDPDGGTRTLKAGGNPDLQLVGDTYVRPAYTAKELAAIAGEVIASRALKANGLVVFSNWEKHVSENGFDMVAFDPATGKLWIIDNKAQFTRGIGRAEALTGEAFEKYLGEFRQFLINSEPDRAAAAKAIQALDNRNFIKVVSNGFAGESIAFTKGLFEIQGLHAFDVRLGKLFYPPPPVGPAGVPGQAEWLAEIQALKLVKGARRVSGQKGFALVEAMGLTALVAGGALAFLRGGREFRKLAGEIAAEFALGAALARIPYGNFATWVLSMESDNPQLMRERRLDEGVETAVEMIPDFDSLTPQQQTETRAILREMLENPVEIPDPPQPLQRTKPPGTSSGRNADYVYI